MVIEKLFLEGCCLIKPIIYRDERGYFSETFNLKQFKKAINLDVNFVQDNESMSSKGVLRGLHFQKGDHAQAKLVRVIKGRVLDVVADLRPNSKTFGKYYSTELSEDNKTQLFVPRGFAHGFLVLEDNTIFSYKCDNFYKKEAEQGIRYNDPQLNIDWRLDHSKLILSEKDKNLPNLNELQI